LIPISDDILTCLFFLSEIGRRVRKTTKTTTTITTTGGKKSTSTKKEVNTEYIDDGFTGKRGGRKTKKTYSSTFLMP